MRSVWQHLSKECVFDRVAFATPTELFRVISQSSSSSSSSRAHCVFKSISDTVKKWKVYKKGEREVVWPSSNKLQQLEEFSREVVSKNISIS